jgi:hypothetical protein
LGHEFTQINTNLSRAPMTNERTWLESGFLKHIGVVPHQ